MTLFKIKTLQTVAFFILENPHLERILRYFSLRLFFRRYFKIGALVFAYSSYLKQPEIRISTIGKYQVYVNIAENQGIHLYFFAEHNEPFAAWLASKLLNEGDVAIDVGANMGSYTFVMANSVYPGGKVFTFEPNIDLYSKLLDSVALNQCHNFISVDNRALYNNSGETLKFYISNNPGNSGTSSLINHGVFISEENFIIVKTITMTDYFKANNIENCKLIKIDVERAELEVLKGAIELLEKRCIDYIILEQLAGSQSQSLLHSLGYEGWLIDEEKKVLIADNQINNDYFGNYLFVNPNCISQFKKQYSALLSN